jgi:2-dehydro-3-deoxyphosphogluconate aldolase / (4S)-4-hydroxy-2-oxoglutarate aldolase
MTLPGPILEQRVIPVARGQDARTVPVLVEALRAGGISSIEITVEGGSGGLEAIAAVSGRDLVVGAGTITTVDHAERAVAAGASFLVTPHLDVGLIEWASTQEVPIVPGALTPTEVATAWRHGPSAVKLFPAHVGGPEYLKSLRGPFPDVALIPTGGVDAGNIAAYIAAGAVAVGVGAWLTAHDDPGLVTERAVELLRQVV